MKTKNTLSISRPWSAKPGRISVAGRSLLAVGCLLAAAATSWAQTNLVIWNAAALTTGPSDGSGNWVGSTNWWSPSGGTNFQWAGSGNQNYVIFGTGSGGAGAYTITNNESTSQPYSVTFTNPGSYTIVGDGTDNGQLQTIIASGGTSTLGPGFYVATNVSASIMVPWRMVGSSDIFLGYNSSITFGQSTYGNLGQFTVKGQSGPGLSVVNFTNGTYGGVNNPSGTTTIDGATVNIIGTAIVNFGTRMDIARSANSGGGYPVANAVVNVGGPGSTSQLNVNTGAGNNSGNHLQISRGGPAVLNVLPGGMVSTLSYISSGSVVSGNLRITPDSSSSGTVNVSGGALYLGTGPGGSPGYSSSALTSITLFDATTPGVNGVAIFNQSGGTVAARSIVIGNGNWTANATNQINISGGTLYLDAGNISFNIGAGKVPGTNYALNLSGGTLSATANWAPACAVPINLTNLNGNITFQCADAGASPHNMAFSGPLTGQGGFNKTGGGTLTLSGANNYAGATIVSNGLLVIATGSLPTNGPVIIDGTAGNPATSVQISGVGQGWTIGSLTYNGGSPAADFNFTNNLSPSSTVAAIRINGNLAFNATPGITVEGSAIPVGTFPLYSYTGTLSGTVPTTVTVNLLSGSATGHLVSNPGSKTISLVVDTSSYNPAIKWVGGSGNWDYTTPNWTSNGVACTFADGDAVVFDDTATTAGSSVIVSITVPSVRPASVSANNNSVSFAINGPGAIAGSATVTAIGSAGFTLNGANAYTGGTAVTQPGRLNINNAGDGVSSSAVGNGPLTLNSGAVIDNTSHGAVTLLTSITENWAESLTFQGTTNFNTGQGTINLTAPMTLTVASNTLEIDGTINQNGGQFGITKVGNGTLVLSNQNNSFSGGLTLSAGTLDINASHSDGTGLLTLSGGNLDNTSGADVSMSSSEIHWNGFTFVGTTNLDLGSGNITVLSSTMNILSNTISTEGELNGANTTLTMNGPGTWMISGDALNTGGFGLTLNSGTVLCNRDYPFPCFMSAVTVNTNGTVVMYNPTGYQLYTTAGFVMSGGLVEFNGDSETFLNISFNPAGGIVRNSMQNSTSLLVLSGNVSAGSTNCVFDVTNTAAMTISGIITNTGIIVKTGGGVLTLVSNNTLSGGVTIVGGTLALADPMNIGAGSISNAALINVMGGATLDVSGRMDQTLTLNSGQTLTGAGSLNGNLVALAGSVLLPGNGVGILTVTNNVTLAGTAVFELNRAGTPTADEIVSVQGTITGGGTLNVTNAGPALQVGDTFHLFPAGVSGFTANLPATDANGYSYTWANNITTDGSISVTGRTVTINPYPGPIQVTVTGSSLTLGWPTNLGWILQAQTNALGAGLSNNWVNVAGSGSQTSMTFPVNAGNGSVFFRLVKPQ